MHLLYTHEYYVSLSSSYSGCYSFETEFVVFCSIFSGPGKFCLLSNFTIQLVVVNQYNTKYEISILYGCGDIFDENSGQKEKRTNIKKNK